jgi:4-hydroxybenzoate polyprenyltransferase
MHPYLRLMRLHQPTGIWLLLWPCWWALALAADWLPSGPLLLLFAVGAVVMRGAGCIVNDMADREFDAQVVRTRTRPLASGEVNMGEAFALLAVLLLAALVIALQLNGMVLLLAVSSLALVVCYPFMKRITWWPQAFLGLTFNWGALMGWAAVTGAIRWPALALYAAGFFWTLAYDTIYAHQDAKDDVKAGVKSTALRLGKYSKPVIAVFYALTLLLLAIAGWGSGEGSLYFAGLIAAGFQAARHLRRVDLDNPPECMEAFRASVMFGAIVFGGMVLDALVR